MYRNSPTRISDATKIVARTRRSLGISARVVVLVTFVFLVAMRGLGQASDTRGALAAAWDVLDSTWAAGHPDQQELVLSSLARVRSARAADIFRQALRGSAGVAARAANLSPDWRVAELLPEISERLKAEKEVGPRIELVGCLKRVRTRAAAEMVLPFALVDAEPLTGVAFGVLSEIGEVAIPALTTALKEGCWTCRESAAYVLMRVATPAATSALRGVLGDANPHVRALAAIALARAGDPSGGPILTATLGDSDYGFRIWATLALYNLGESQYQSALLKEYDAASPDRRSFVARQIVREGRPPLRDQVIGLALNDPSPVVRAALFEVPDNQSSGSFLLALMKDPDAGIRILVAQKLLQEGLARADATRVVRESINRVSAAEREGALTALAKGGVGGPERDIVEAALDSSEPIVQAAAIRAMRRFGQDAVQRIAPMLDTANVFVSAAAANVLVEISPAAAIPMLAGQLQSPKPGLRVICAGYLIYALEVSKR